MLRRLPANVPRTVSLVGRNSVSARRRGWRDQRTLAAKQLWLATQEQECLTTAVELGYSTVLFGEDERDRAALWGRLATIRELFVRQDGSIVDQDDAVVGTMHLVSSKQSLQAAELAMTEQSQQPGGGGCVVVDASAWKIIPAENLVAAAQAGQGRVQLMAVAATASDARVMLEALELGTSGVVLRTDDPAQVRELAAYLSARNAEAAEALPYAAARVTRVTPVGMGDRACVDLCSLLAPGEGLLVGSFSRALFLVHSECLESSYINSRPFRVNAGPVHAYVQLSGGRTAYLSELRSGAEVLVADAGGRVRTVLVGRVKVESRPLVLVEAETPSGDCVSILLQNAETVRLIGPPPADCGTRREGDPPPRASPPWRAVSVSELRAGDAVWLLQQEGARHIGISIKEQISEK